MCSDAGTPGISDPGFLLLRACVEQDIEVECLPGATALIPALVASALPCDRFVFEGFLPHKKGKQTKILALQDEERTTVFYESPHRIIKSLEMILDLLGADRQVVVARELTKKFEEIIRGSVVEVIAHLNENQIKGEFVLLVAGKNYA
jgi:16S rRNA (cytidine1402-2'-O)-methyltransferase